jgi:hypothetical protein
MKLVSIFGIFFNCQWTFLKIVICSSNDSREISFDGLSIENAFRLSFDLKFIFENVIDALQ